MFAATVMMMMSITTISIISESDILISCWLKQGPQLPPICISSSGKWGGSITVRSLQSGCKEQVRACEALGTIPGPWPMESTE